MCVHSVFHYSSSRCVDVWITGGEHQMAVRNVPLSMSCRELYSLVAKTTGIPPEMLTLTTGVKILQQNHALHCYASSSSFQHGLNIFFLVKCLGGGKGDGNGNTFVMSVLHYIYLALWYIEHNLHVGSCGFIL